MLAIEESFYHLIKTSFSLLTGFINIFIAATGICLAIFVAEYLINGSGINKAFCN
jgi:hypothetical protein